jgi:site-specific recombinase XerD
VFPSHRDAPWAEPPINPGVAARSTPRTAAQIDHATPYTLRHSFASLLLHEGRSVIYVAANSVTTPA